MQVIVVDGETLNPGDLSWKPLGQYGAYQAFPHSTPEDALMRCRSKVSCAIPGLPWLRHPVGNTGGNRRPAPGCCHCGRRDPPPTTD
jgi:hypothetical protein